MDKVKEEVMGSGRPRRCRKSPACPRARCSRSPRRMAKNRPSSIVWCMGQTQHTIGNAMVRAFCILQLALGNVGVGRRRQHLPRPRQRAGRDRHRPESGFAAGLLRHRARTRSRTGRSVWNVDLEWLKKQFAAGDDGEARHHGVALDRRRDREERAASTRIRTCAPWSSGAMRPTPRRAAWTWSRR